MRVLGMISGTSHDGIDLAVVDFTLEPTDSPADSPADSAILHGVVRHVDCVPYSPALRERLIRALPPAPAGFAEMCALDTLVGQAFADAAVTAGPVDLICSHGQTVFHWTEGQAVLGTLQIGQPAWIAERTGAPVVSDVRARDVAAGGQGAPLVALMDAMLLAGLPGRVAALNLGGIANITVFDPVPADSAASVSIQDAGPVLAYDIGPGNALIDAAVSRLTGGAAHYDRDGRLAAAGQADERLLARLLAEPYYALPPPKTTGKELFNAAYLSDVDSDNLITTLTLLTAETVAAEVRRHHIGTLVASGGGCANPTLMGMLRERVPGVRVVTSDEFGAPADAKEAIAFALIGWLTAHGLPASTPACPGRRVLGTVTPGRDPWRLPRPITQAPTRLRLSV